MIERKLRAKKCKECGEKFKPVRPLQMVCGFKCAASYARAQEWKKRKKKLKEKTKTLTNYKNEARKVFQKWIRQRDKDLPCISCGNRDTEYWNAGHYKKAELYSGLVFDERNISKQCVRCNLYLDGNEANYREGLIKRYGEDYVLQLERDADLTRDKKYTKEELIEIKKYYREKLKK